MPVEKKGKAFAYRVPIRKPITINNESIISKKSDQDLSNEGSNFILSSVEVGH